MAAPEPDMAPELAMEDPEPPEVMVGMDEPEPPEAGVEVAALEAGVLMEPPLPALVTLNTI